MAQQPTFVGVRGHASVQAQLQRALRRGQLHHGLIFVGPRGVGKGALARGLACALHCARSPGVGCGECSACRRILGGNHAGVEWVAPEGAGGTIKVAVARELANRLELAPFEGQHHVVVFDPAEALTEQSYNALLKTIEEPRPGVHFVMLTTGLDRLLPTILSRCLAIRVGRLDDETVESIVRNALAEREPEEDAPEVSEERIALAVRLADGSAGVAVSLALDAGLDASVQLLRQVVAAADAGPARIFAGDKSPLWAAWHEASGGPGAGRPARERAAAGRLAQLWLLHLRERMRGREGLPGLRGGADHPRAILGQLDKVQTFVEGLDRNPNVRLALESTLLELGQDAST